MKKKITIKIRYTENPRVEMDCKENCKLTKVKCAS